MNSVDVVDGQSVTSVLEESVYCGKGGQERKQLIGKGWADRSIEVEMER